MGTTTKTLIAAGLLCAGGLYVYSLAQEPPPRRADHAVAEDASAATPATSTTGGKQEEVQRVGAPPAEAVAAWLDHPYRFDLEVFVVDKFGLPVEGHTLRLSPPAGTMVNAPGASGADGMVTMSWRSRLPDGGAVLADDHGTRRRIELRHGSKTRVTLLGTRRDRGAGMYLTVSSGAFTVSLDAQKPVLTRVPLVGKFFESANAIDDAAPHAGLHPYVVFDTATTKVERPTAAEATLTELAFDSMAGAHLASMVLGEFRAPDAPARSEPAPSQAAIAGTVFGEDGKPAAKVPVFLLGTGPQPVQQVETDEAGQFVFEKLLAGQFAVRAGGTDAGLATAPATTTTGTTPATLHLRRGACVRGKALAADGSPMAGATISWRSADGTWCDETASQDDGSFVLANLPGSTGTVLLWAPGDAHHLPVASAVNVLCDTGELVLRADAATASALLVEPVLPEGIHGGVAVRLWHTDLGIATPVPDALVDVGERDAADGAPHRLGGLCAGWYRVEMHHATTGWIDAGRHWLDGKVDCDLGRVLLPAPAKVQVELDPAALPAVAQRAFEVCSLRTDVDVRYSGADPADTLLLPGGDYVFAWRDADGAVRFHRFTAIGGRQTTVRPPR